MPRALETAWVRTVRPVLRLYPFRKGQVRLSSVLLGGSLSGPYPGPPEPIIRAIPHGVVTQCRHGLKLRLQKDAAFIWPFLFGEYEEPNSRVYSRLISPGDVVFDVGASYGWYSALFGKLVGESGQVHAFEPASFDVVVSNAGAMFFDDQNAAFTNLRTALKPGGRIVLLVWQVLENNEWLTELRRALALGRDLPTPPVGTPGPFGLADPDHTRDLLARTGYSSVRIEDVRPPMRLGDDVESAYSFVSRMGNTRGLLNDLGEDDRIVALNNLRSVLAEHATARGVVLGTASWLVTATH